MTRIFEEILMRGVEEGSFLINKKDVNLVSHNIMVLGHMWAFRRWVLRRNYTLKRYIEAQTGLILRGITAGRTSSG